MTSENTNEILKEEQQLGNSSISNSLLEFKKLNQDTQQFGLTGSTGPVSLSDIQTTLYFKSTVIDFII